MTPVAAPPAPAPAPPAPAPVRERRSAPPPAADRVGLAPVVRLSKHEVVDACQVLADADRCLVGVGCATERSALGDLFELLEDRLTGGQSTSGENSRESEFTQ